MAIGAMFGDNFLPKFRDELGSDGSTSKFVELMLEVDEATFEGNLAQRRASALKDGQTVASNYNRAAQVAADKGCPQLGSCPVTWCSSVTVAALDGRAGPQGLRVLRL